MTPDEILNAIARAQATLAGTAAWTAEAAQVEAQDAMRRFYAARAQENRACAAEMAVVLHETLRTMFSEETHDAR